MKDRAVLKIIEEENYKQNNTVTLIASENFVSEDVLSAGGSIFTNKYAEGYPGHRYYFGTKHADEIETLAIERLKKLFNVQYANVQPHSGSQANAAALCALVKPGGKIMGLSLKSGGHLTHGYKITFSGTFFESITYDVDKNGLLDYEAIEAIALKEKPDLIICGFSAYSRKFDFNKFREIADKVDCLLMADIAHIAGLVATGLHPSPVGIADVITSTTHKTLRGARGGIVMTNNPELAKKINRWVFPGTQGGPLMHQIAAKAVSFGEALKPEFKTYIQNVVDNSKAFANKFQELNVPVISGGTDNHLFTINVLKGYNITGQEASEMLERNNIIANKNTIPFDTKSPRITSGVRLGTAAMTTKGFTKEAFEKLAILIHKLLSKELNNIEKEVKKLLKNNLL